MDALVSALADPARWRLVGLLADRPRPVGVLARLAGARQPQTTKHLQTLERAGIVTSRRVGQRRVYALRPGPLRDLAAELTRLADLTEHEGGAAADLDRTALTLDAERQAARAPGWADGRAFHFHRTLTGDPGRVWRHLTDPSLLAQWWTPDALRTSELVFQARPGGRIVQEYRDAEDIDGTDTPAGRADGTVDDVRPGERLAFRLAPHLPGGGPAFTAHLELLLSPAPGDDGPTGPGDGPGTELDVHYRITDSTVDAADFVAGIETGFRQSLDRLAALLAETPAPATVPPARTGTTGHTETANRSTP
ncbi:metalloregulator ArsR/SmtB family transcription factor [Actinomadura harenae]|uniref:ArsR family transcriptional regulator n=1 Tax=Actinomadura harenae TaxID=2483351 RepID=A0A3M2LNJ4_9ACTN|nr:metalloregulator ArsR/SmtB family transcription factor [Actinomadura harenae]RMI38989.1 ArsR family transcriptional regulator [Actinomadura harenae]